MWSAQLYSGGGKEEETCLSLELELKLPAAAEVPLLHFHANTAKGKEEFKLNLLCVGS